MMKMNITTNIFNQTIDLTSKITKEEILSNCIKSIDGYIVRNAVYVLIIIAITTFICPFILKQIIKNEYNMHPDIYKISKDLLQNLGLFSYRDTTR